MITLKNIKKAYGEVEVLRDVNITINENEKVAIVGTNGSGKTTLINIIKNEDIATFGEVIYANHSIEFLDQERQLSEYNTVSDVIQSLMSQFKNISNQISEIVNDENFTTDLNLINKYGELENKYISLGGYEREAEVKRVFAQLYFNKDMYGREIESLSGGQKTRLALAKLLLNNPDFLILDEPTNHLDIATIMWLEDYLRNRSKGVIIVSHDRFFVDRVCNRIIEVENGEICSYNTNYQNYILEKKLRYEREMATYNNQQSEIKKHEEFIAKNRSKPSKIGQVNDRKKKLQHMDLISKPYNNYERVSFEIESLHRKRSAYVELIDLSIGYDSPILNNLNLTINAGDKIGLIGENASGKSSLVKTILKYINPVSGTVSVHPKINIGYFDQNFLDLDYDNTVFEFIEMLMNDSTQTAIRKHLAQFLFRGNDVHKKISNLSGGEKVRLIFAKLVLEKYDLLIMDEPTNHLDLRTKEELEDVLKLYDGTLLIISHDRYFIDSVATKIWAIENNSIETFDGSYFSYITFKNQSKIEHITKAKTIKQKQKNAINNTKKIEKEIEKLELEIEKLNNESLLEENYSDFKKMGQINKKIEILTNDVNKQYELLQNL